MLGALISAGSSLLGGLLGKSSADKQMDMQRQFAKNGIQWKVEDAKKAGIHPLYALGANTMSYSPVATGDYGVSQAGQDIGRAIDATRSQGDRTTAITKTMQDLQLQRMGLENELLSAQIAKVRQPGQPPARAMPTDKFVIDGQGETFIDQQHGQFAPTTRASVGGAMIQPQAHKPVVSAPGQPESEPGSVSDLGFTRTRTGWAPVMSKDAKERLEEDWPGMLWWNVRNRVAPTLGGPHSPPPVPLPSGYRWYWNGPLGEYQMKKADDRSPARPGAPLRF